MAVSRRRTRTTTSSAKSGSGRTLGNVDANIKKSAKRFKSPDWVKVPDGESTVVRVIDIGDDFRDGFVHPVEFERKKGKSFTRDVMCLDQNDDGTPCPGCRDDLDRRYKFWTRVIEREAEKTNDSDKVVGYEDQVKILSSGKRLVGALNKKHKKRDLSLRDVEIEREGTGWDTDYTVEWVDEEDNPLTKAELKLIEESEIDLDRYTTVPDFDDFYELPDRDNDDDDDVGEKSKRRGSAFGEKKTRSSSRSTRDEDDDDDDEDERPRRRRRTSGRKPSSGIASARAKKASGNAGKPTIRSRRTSR
jgi:hypothetical protein